MIGEGDRTGLDFGVGSMYFFKVSVLLLRGLSSAFVLFLADLLLAVGEESVDLGEGGTVDDGAA